METDGVVVVESDLLVRRRPAPLPPSAASWRAELMGARAAELQLVAEFAGRASPGGVLRCVARCRVLLAHAGRRDGLAGATTALSRAVLSERVGVPGEGRRPAVAPSTAPLP